MRPVYTLNLVVVALQPLVLLGLISYLGLQPSLPVWGRGIVLSWAFYMPLWSIFGWNGAQMPKLQKAGFLLFSFVMPIVMAFVMGDSLAMVGLDIAVFQTLGIGIGLGLVMILAFLNRLFDVRFSGLRPTHVSFRSLGEIFQGGFEGPLIFVIGLIIFGTVVMPPIAAEALFFRMSDRPIWYWVGRYFSLIPEVSIFLPIWSFGAPGPKTAKSQ